MEIALNASNPHEPPRNLSPFEKLRQRAEMRRVRHEARILEQQIRFDEQLRLAGNLLSKGRFGMFYIEVYSFAYVRISTSRKMLAPNGDFAPFERLIDASFDPGSSVGTDASGATLIGSAASIIGGTLRGFRGSLPGLAVAGVGHYLSKRRGKACLTFATEYTVHSLTNEVIADQKFERSHISMGESLYRAAMKALGKPLSNEAPVQPQISKAQAQSLELSAPEKLRKLSILHTEGILSDEEFAQAKARIIENL